MATNRGLIIARKDGTTDEVVPVAADPLGRLIVVGGGVASSSSVFVTDTDDPTRRLKVNADGTINVLGPLTDAQLRATAVPVRDTNVDITISALRDAVRGVNNKTLTDIVNALAATLQVSGPLTNAELRAVPVSVADGNINITLSALRDALRGVDSKTLTDVVNALAAPLTNTQLRAAPVAVTDANIDITVTALRDAIRGVSNRTLTDIYDKLNATIAVTQSGQWSTYPNRPAAKTGRTRVRGFTTGTSLGSTLYTVTPGKTLYVESVTVTFVNSSTQSTADLRIQDGSTAVKFPFVATTTIIGQTAPSVSPPIVLFDPVPFTTDFRIVIASGSVFYACFFEGYEE